MHLLDFLNFRYAMSPRVVRMQDKTGEYVHMHFNYVIYWFWLSIPILLCCLFLKMLSFIPFHFISNLQVIYFARFIGLSFALLHCYGYQFKCKGSDPVTRTNSLLPWVTCVRLSGCSLSGTVGTAGREVAIDGTAIRDTMRNKTIR